jgi:hypothetical protein
MDNCEMKNCDNPQDGNWIGPFIQLGRKVCFKCNQELNYWHGEIGT